MSQPVRSWSAAEVAYPIGGEGDEDSAGDARLGGVVDRCPFRLGYLKIEQDSIYEDSSMYAA